MKLYSVNCLGTITNDEWSIVTIHKTLEGAEQAMNQYIKNATEYDARLQYTIYIIDTDIDSDVVYSYDNVENKE